MSRFLQILNLLGILALALLCSAQWRANRALNLDIIDREKQRLQRVAQIDEQAKSIKGYTADLDDFRQRITLSEAALKESEQKYHDLAGQRDELAVERDQLKSSLDKFTAAVAERDAALKKAGEQIVSLSADRNDAIDKFNDLCRSTMRLWKRRRKRAGTIDSCSGHRSPHRHQESVMRSQRAEEGSLGGIAHAELVAGLFHHFGDSHVICVANPAEEMMLDLEIQPAEEPAHHRVCDAKNRRWSAPR